MSNTMRARGAQARCFSFGGPMPQEMTEVPINANESFYWYVYCFTGMKKVPLQHDTVRARGAQA